MIAGVLLLGLLSNATRERQLAITLTAETNVSWITQGQPTCRNLDAESRIPATSCSARPLLSCAGMKCSFLILLALAGCTSEENFPPSVTIGVSGTSVTIEYDRGTDHDFRDLKGTVNGIDLGSADISEGSLPQQVLSSPIPSSAVWQIDAAEVGGSAHVDIDDGGEDFILDATIDGLNTVVTDCSSNLTC